LQYKYTVLTNTTIGAFMAQLDANIVLISLPTIIRDLPDTSTLDGIWIIMGYTLISATLLLTIGRLGDIFGRVRLYNAGFAIFTIGSGLCSVAPNGLVLVLFRLVQGLGGALIWANNAAILTDAFGVNERGKAIGINQVAGTSGSVLGLVAGGALTQSLGWRSIFWINIPVGIFATAWAYARLKERGELSKNRRLDPLGNLLFALGLAVFLLGMSLGALTGWSPTDLYMMAAGLIALVAFVVVEIKVSSPMMDLSLFRIRAFSAGIFSNLLASLARGGVGLVLVFYFQGALLLDALTAGVLLIPFSLAFVGAGPLSGYLSDRYGARGFSTGGLLLSAAAMFLFSILPANVPYSVLVIPMVMAGVGGGMFVAPNIASVMNSVPVGRRGVASGMASMLVNTGFLLSLGMCFAIMATVMPLGVLQAVFAGIPVASGAVDLGLFMTSMHEIFFLMGALSLVAALLSSLRGPKPIS
jgi:EmrB/QacA subfamily drug resistance transporter